MHDVAHESMSTNTSQSQPVLIHHDNDIHDHEEVEETLNIMDKEKELIIKALKKHKGKRKDAALILASVKGHCTGSSKNMILKNED